MNTFNVWAPRARRVDVDFDGRRVALAEAGGGLWRGGVARVGADYGFVVDGHGPLPDPRSSFQPFGVHGPSRVIDHAAFSWSDRGWQPPPLSGGLVYELHVGTFSGKGTFDGVVEHLDHLVDLGISHVELMPVCEFPGTRGWGYDGVDLWAPHHAYGGPDGLKRLVDACHARGLAVLLDVVYNHLGPAGNYLGRFGPYFTDRHHTPWGEAVNLDGPGSDHVRRFLCDNAVMWLRDYHVDGLRLDAVHALVDTSARPFLEQLTEEVAALEAQLGRHLVVVAESDLNDPRLLRPREMGGFGVDAQWSDDFHHALHAALIGERTGYYEDFGTLEHLKTALERAWVYAGRYSAFRGRTHGRSPVGVTGHRLFGYLQNHDQVGNRARGERSSHVMSTARLKIAAALVLTAPFVPMLFQGEEWAASTSFQYFTDHDDPAIGRTVSEGRRREFAAFGWRAEEVPDPQAPETFACSRLDWAERTRQPHAGVLDWHRDLVRLRRATPALTDGRLEQVQVRVDEERRWLVMTRGPVSVACNLGPVARRLTVAEGRAGEVRLSSPPHLHVEGSGVLVPPDGVAIVEIGRGNT